jgi:hypothetical protein
MRVISYILIILILIADSQVPGRGKLSYRFLTSFYNQSISYFYKGGDSSSCLTLSLEQVNHLFSFIRHKKSIEVKELESILGSPCSIKGNTYIWETYKGIIEGVTKPNGKEMESIKNISL